MMHILILPSWYLNSYSLLSGIFFKEQAEALAKNGNKIGVIAIHEISVRDILKQKKITFTNKYFIENDVYTFSVEYPAIPKLYRIRKYIKQKIFQKIFQRYIQLNGLPEIIHLHSFMVGEFAIWIKENYGIPYVITEHSSGFFRNMILSKDLERARKVFEKSNANIAVSKQFSFLLENKFNLTFEYVPNIVNINFFTIKEFSQKNTFSFINIAFLNKNKNQDMLIKSFTKVFRDNVNITLTIVGDGPEYTNLKNLVENLNMESQILLYGKASRDEVKLLLQKSDAFVLSSQFETFGVVIIEAMACGLAVIATKCGGPESIINSYKVGLLSEINETDLSEKFKELYNNRFNYNKKYIRRYTEENFSEEIVIKKLITIYDSLLNN